MFRFESLDAWKKSAALSVDIYQVFSDVNDFAFRNQITRAGLSISSNIAEGYERESHKERANFLNYAKGSAGELRSQVYIGMKIGYIEPTIGKKWIQQAEEISRMLHSLIQKFKNK